MILVSVIVCLPTRPVHAQVAVTDPVVETETTLTVANSTISSTAEDSLWIKEYVLDPIAWMVAKTMVQSMTNSTVAWINGGFNGSPAFIQDPEQFFMKLGDNIAGNFIAGPGSPLSALCSPIALNVRLALALNISGGGSGGSGGSSANNPYTCTLSQVINNVNNASVYASVGGSVNVNGASIAGFEAGDFSQGGWPAFAALAEPQNSFYGAYLQSSAQLSATINGQQIINQNLLNQGQGFLSWSQCSPTTAAQGTSNAPSQWSNVVGSDSSNSSSQWSNVLGSDSSNSSSQWSNSLSSSNSSGNIPDAPPGAMAGSAGGQNCQIVTPGSVISSSLNKSLGSAQDSLVTADEIDEIVGALASQLVNHVLGGTGLAGVSQPSGGQSSYLDQIQAESNTNNSNVAASVGQTLSSDVNRYIGYAQNVNDSEYSSLQIMLGVAAAYQTASSTCTSVGDTPVVLQINSDVINKVNPLIMKLQSEYNTASTTLANLNNFEQLISNATSTTDINNYTQEFNATRSQLPGPQDEINASLENTQVTASSTPLFSAAQSYQAECSALITTATSTP